MPRPSSIDKLDPQIRDLIGQLRDRGRTLDEIRARLSDMLGEDAPSRSALHRHIQGLDVIAEDMRRARAAAEVLVRNLGDEPDNKLAQLNIQMAHTIMYKVMNPDGGLVSLEPQEAMHVASAIQKLTSAAKSDADLRAALRREIAAEMEKAKKVQAETAAKAATQRGMTEADVEFLRAQILGVKIEGRAA